MNKELGIKSSVYRQKLRLNSLDVVLFGYKDNNNRTKDILLAFLVWFLKEFQLKSFIEDILRIRLKLTSKSPILSKNLNRTLFLTIVLILKQLADFQKKKTLEVSRFF